MASDDGWLLVPDATQFASLPNEVLSLVAAKLSEPPHGVQPAVLAFCLTSRGIRAAAREQLASVATWRRLLRGFNSQTSPRRAAQWLREHGNAPHDDDATDAELLTAFLRSSHQHVEPRLLGELITARGGDSSVQPAVMVDGVLEAILGELEGCSLVDVLRRLTAALMLPGEAAKIDRLLEAVAERWHAANPHALGSDSSDSAYVVSFALLMLSTDRWNPNIARDRRMGRVQWRRSLAGVHDGGDLPASMVDSMYTSIMRLPIGLQPRSQLIVRHSGWLRPVVAAAELLRQLGAARGAGAALAGEHGALFRPEQRLYCVLTRQRLYMYASDADDVPVAFVYLICVRARRTADGTPRCFALRHAEQGQRVDVVQCRRHRPASALRADRSGADGQTEQHYLPFSVVGLQAASEREAGEWLLAVQDCPRRA